jgi:hypothetical protein
LPFKKLAFMLLQHLQNDVGEGLSGGRIRRCPERQVGLSLDLVFEEADVASESGKFLRSIA